MCRMINFYVNFIYAFFDIDTHASYMHRIETGGVSWNLAPLHLLTKYTFKMTDIEE